MHRAITACALLSLLLAGGCRMCQSYTDCAPVVVDGPYSHARGRAGSILSGGLVPLPDTTEQVLPESPEE